MELSKEARETIVKEIKIVTNMMKEGQNPPEKLYYFSAIYGILQRVYNIEYHEELLFAHFVLQMTYHSFMQRITAMKQGDMTISISDEQINKLTVLSEKFGKKLQKDEDFVDVLKSMVTLSYSTQGNGYYLMKKGILKI